MSEGKAKFAYLKQVAIGAASGVATLALIIAGFSISGTATPNNNTNADSANPDSSASPSASATPTFARTCSVATESADPMLATFAAAVINPATDEILFDRSSELGAAPASTQKMLTASAALQVLGPNYRVELKV